MREWDGNTLFPLRCSHVGKLKSYLMVGLSKSSELWAGRKGPRESGCNYAMEKKSRESWSERRGRKKKRWKQRDGKTCHCEIRYKMTIPAAPSGLLTPADHLGPSGEEDQERGGGPDLRFTLPLWEKGNRRLERTSYVTPSKVLCCGAMATGRPRRESK